MESSSAVTHDLTLESVKEAIYSSIIEGNRQ